MSTEKVLVVVTVFEGRKFLCCSDASLVIDGVIDGYTLSTDAVPLTALQLNLQTELAWEMDRKTLHQHKLHHTPIKLQVFTVDNATCTRKCMGYVLLHLRTANPLGKGLPLWHKLLNAQVQGSPPELFLSLCVEEKIEEKHSTSKDLDDALILHPSGEHYSFGSPSEKMHLFVISVTLDNPSGLPESLSPYYYNYNLLDVDIASEQFVYNEFKTEKASIRILCSRERLRKLLSLKQRMKITLCQSDQFLGKGSLSLKPLLTDDVLKCEVEMGIESESASFVDVTLEVQKDNSSLPTIKDIDHTENRLFVKRSLARCFEAVSDVKTSLSDYSLSQEQNELCPATPDVSPFIVDSAEIEQTVPKTVRSSASDNLSPFEEVVRNSPHQEFRTVHNCEAVAGLQKNNGGANTTSTEPVSKNRLKSTWEHLTSSTDSCVHPVQDDLSFSSNINVPVHRVHVSTQTELSSESITPSPYAISRSCLSGECEESGNAIHQYQFSIEIHSIHNINLEEGLKCCVRFRYPFFGSQQPVVVQPPVSLVLGGENYFSASTYSFVFACSEDSLHNQLYCHPILLEVLMERGNCHSLVGIAQVSLGEVLKNEKVSLGNDVYQRCSLKVPVSAVVSQLTCAFVHCTLTLEYQKGFPPAETQGLPSASEYLAATKLEMWKASEEETFTKEMKKKEACYLFQLQEEWERREKERQAVFTQKFQAYNCLEVQLRNTLEAAQCEQRKLLSRETELQQLYRKLSFEEQSIAKQCQAKVMQCQLLYEGKLEVQREKAEELLKTVERLMSQVSELSARLTSKDAEFDEYKQKVISKPESRLQAELIMVHIEKTELEKKLSTALRAKKHYKDQWTQAMKELAAYRHNELKSAQSILQRQQQELESVKIHSEEQKIIRKDLTQVKEEVSRVQKETFNDECPSKVTEAEDTANPDVARWIEERDILLETGVYTQNDFTIQQLDQKIKACLK